MWHFEGIHPPRRRVEDEEKVKSPKSVNFVAIVEKSHTLQFLVHNFSHHLVLSLVLEAMVLEAQVLVEPVLIAPVLVL